MEITRNIPVLRSIDWDKVRLLILAVWALTAFALWLRNNIRSRGKSETMRSLVRVCASAVGGISLSLLAYAIGSWRPENLWFFIPMMPGFFIAAITVGVHRGDNLLRNVVVFLNALMYSGIMFTLYTRYTRLMRRQRRA